ncbi:MAG: hypothetical protein OSB07_10500 [Dehalococcoidia bacterium]|jgi:hypothetical protein|nr:hypothetical protein [Dehalococcoidia bacterium]
MAGKSRRTASRQGQLKRKKIQKGPSGIPGTRQQFDVPEDDDAVAVTAGVDDAEISASEGEDAGAVAAVARAPREPRPSPVARTPRGEFAGQGQNRLRGERPAAYLYVGAEFRRILTLTSVIVAALIVLGIVL